MELKGNVVSVDIEVVYVPLDYNVFLGDSWFYAMTIVASSFFFIFQFPHQWNILTVDQLDYYTPDLHNSLVNNIHFLGYSELQYESVGVGLLKDSSLMVFFSLPPPNPPHEVSMLNMITAMVQ